MFSKDFIEFIDCLNKCNVDYMVVGGYAVGFHGLPRTTGDLDIWIKISETNADNMMRVVDMYPVPRGIFSRELFLNDKPLNGGFFGKEPYRIDVLTDISGVRFDECFPSAMHTIFEGIKVVYISYDDLIKNKIASGRPQDIADALRLKKINEKINKFL
ncbi:MAG: hypothetical protein ABI855_13885 [Bacteroidota bacterium]